MISPTLALPLFRERGLKKKGGVAAALCPVLLSFFEMKNTKVSFHKACRMIREGGVVAVPTETVYGLAGSIHSKKALRQIFQIKKRPLFDPLIVHFSERKQLKNLCRYKHPIVEKLSEVFHPGPLTLVLRKKQIISSFITAGSNKAAVRMPHHPLTLKLMKETNTPLAAPSANLFSKTSPTRADHVLDSLNIPVLDGGPCPVGIESTILEVCEEKQKLLIRRLGAVRQSEIESFLIRYGFEDWGVKYEKSSSFIPGASPRHYRPDIPFVIIESKKAHSKIPKKIEDQLKKHYPELKPMELKLKNDPFVVSRELYHQLRQMSKSPQSVGYVIKQEGFEKDEMWQAIWDRLAKASETSLYV